MRAPLVPRERWTGNNAAQGLPRTCGLRGAQGHSKYMEGQGSSASIVDGQCCLVGLGSAAVGHALAQVVSSRRAHEVTHLDLSGNNLECVAWLVACSTRPACLPACCRRRLQPLPLPLLFRRLPDLASFTSVGTLVLDKNQLSGKLRLP